MDLKDGFLAVKVRLFLMKNEAMWIFTLPGIILPWLIQTGERIVQQPGWRKTNTFDNPCSA